MTIGGMFCLENAEGELQDYLGQLEGDIRFCMSGRCGIYYCLLDCKRGDDKRVAYLPAYTCETVLDSYVKAGYALRFYDVSPERLTPLFDREMIPRISVLGLCGYYGFSYYDRDFVRDCGEAGVTIVHDITHSAFSADGIDANADYVAGSYRKWMGIPSGGIALKRRGRFSLPLLPPEEEHIRGRLACFEERARVVERRAGSSEERVGEIFWETELRLRRMFDAFESDALSKEILTHYPYRDLIRRRRENYASLLEKNPFSENCRAVFPELPDGVCPSHLALYSEERESVQAVLSSQGVKSTVYWPVPPHLDPREYPGAEYIYRQIHSLPIDQRYSIEDMEKICEALVAVGN